MPPRAPRPVPHPVTLPYAAAALQDHEAPTRVGTAPPVVEEPVHWSSDWDPGRGPDGFHEEPAHDDHTIPQRRTRVLPDGSTEYVSAEYGPDRRERVPAGERVRRSLLLLAGAGVVTGAVAFAPWVALAVSAIAVWILRSASIAASSSADRRNRRGARWYDGIQVMLAAPWHVMAGLGGTVLLLFWSLCIAVAVALVCFAASLSMTTSLTVIGVFFALGTWWGPGSERLQSPIHRVVDPLARRGVPWLLATLLVAAVASGLGAAVAAQGTDWTPDDSAPFSDVRLPAWL
jgi:hypothetical protein